MKKLFLGLILISFPFFPIKTPEIPQIPKVPASDSYFATYADEGLTQKKVDFSPGETVYVFAKVNSSKEANATLALFNENKEKVANIAVEKVSEGYRGHFSAPGQAGIYYVRMEVEGEGLSFIGERNINVKGDVQVNREISIENEVVAGTDTGNISQVVDETREGNFFVYFWALLREFLKKAVKSFTFSS